MTAYVLAVDGGSQSTKVSVVDGAGVVHVSAAVPLRPYALGPGGRAVHPDDDLWDTLVEASRRALDRFDGAAGDIVAVGLCGIRFCRAMLDARGRLSEPVLSWMDARTSRPVRSLDPEVDLVCGAGGYLAVRLTGERRDSAASYQGTWPLDPRTRRWSEDPAELARSGLPAAVLPELVEPAGLLGHVTAEASARTGIPAGTPVHATANDKAVEALGAGLLGPGTTLLSLGTYVAAMTLGEDRPPVDDRYWVNAAAQPGRYLYETRGVRRGMWTVSWLRALVSAAAPDLVDEHEVQRWLEHGARDVPPGSEGLLTVPDWLPPDDAPYRRGALLGLDGRHGPHHLHRSILEGIVMTMHGHVSAMHDALGRPLERLVVSGGGSRSDLMMRIVAEVFGRPAERSGAPDAAGLGAAICAAVGAGLHTDFASAVAAMVRPGDVVEPDPESRERYAALLDVYAGLGDFTDPMFRRMAAL
ncbi:MAG TPA: FGGY-family carbohydrate kinase [Stackebrandtia sp.]|uniref:FGGY-family carbohydrate kinase n=1 Tax=Stackebrandtia sp. TaxID=2023065 RepID=UPI002D5A71DE|nr:FGGY-family carbohydrate kinase [Stackebrandtia sp.]HZE40308.1 FGGY-family carbohydrate kinase [Stackebrandtia sp.]